jgi:DNA-binding NarL/FixJ family response regulator
MKPIKVLIIDDDPAVLRSSSKLMLTLGWMVATRNNAFSARQDIREEAPDVVLLDIDMPALRGDRLVELLNAGRVHGRPQILLYSGLEEQDLRMRAIRCSADGWVRKGGPIVELIERVRSAAERARSSPHEIAAPRR